MRHVDLKASIIPPIKDWLDIAGIDYSHIDFEMNSPTRPNLRKWFEDIKNLNNTINNVVAKRRAYAERQGIVPDPDDVYYKSPLPNGYKYGKWRGTGAIQLTFDYAYKDFYEWMAKTFLVDLDPNIMNIDSDASEYMAMNYTWETAMHFWEKGNLNAVADGLDNYSMHAVSLVVNYGMSKGDFTQRDVKYQNWMNTYDFPI